MDGALDSSFTMSQRNEPVRQTAPTIVIPFPGDIICWSSGDMSPATPKVLVHYGCSQLDIEVAEKYLTASAQTIQRGGVISEVSKEAIRWLQENAVETWPTSKEPVA